MFDKRRIHVSRREALLGTAAVITLPAMLSGEARAAIVRDSALLRIARNQSFDFGWKFHRGGGDGFEAPSFNDHSWRTLDLPHDWSIEDLPPGDGRIGPFDPKSETGGSTAYTVGGEG